MAAALPGPRPERISAPAARHVHLPRTLRPDLRRATRSAGVIGGAAALTGHDLTMPERQRRVVRYGVLMTTKIRISALFLVRPEVSEVEDHPPRACPAAAAGRHHIGNLSLPRRIRQRLLAAV